MTFHESCHLGLRLGIADSVRGLIGRCTHLELVEMDGAGDCCGGGGSFALSHPRIAEAIGTDKADAIRRTGARAVVTSCPGCALQIRAALRRAGCEIPVLHPLELLDAGVVQSLKREPNDNQD